MTLDIFDSMKGMTHYFIRPEDQFVLNSLELVDCDEFLYRVLKNKGYKRVVFFERTAGLNSFAYDEISNLSITSVEKFKTVDMDNPESVQEFLGSVREKGKEIPAQGKYKVPLGKANIATFVSNFENHIMKALQSENAKTAIVMPLDIFKGLNRDGVNNADGKLQQIVGMIEHLTKNNRKQENIIVFTMSKKEELLEVYRDSTIRDIHRDFPSIDGIHETHQRMNTIFEALKGRITLIDTIGTDEVANLLIRKKTLEPGWRKELSDIPYSKIYALANLLREHMIGKKKHFESMDEVKETYITTLNNYFEQNRTGFVSELQRKTSDLAAQEVFDVREADAVCVDRLTHQYRIFTNTCLEDDVLKEMDNLIGKEMQDVKKQIKAAIEQFERERERYLKKKAAGKLAEMPYMNLCIFGPPGTGKSTIGEFIARLLNAKRILPTDGFIAVDASKLKRSNVGGTAEQILEIAKKANGGVLLIDEFYGFDSPHSTGNGAQEAMDALITAINLYRENLCVIIAGYEKKTEKVLSFNEGNDRRFPEKIRISAYTTESLMEVFDGLLLREDINRLEEGLRDIIQNVIEVERKAKGEEFGNVGFLKDKLLRGLQKGYADSKRNDNIYRKEDLLHAFPEYKLIIEREKETDVLKEFEKYDWNEMHTVKDNLLNIVREIEKIRSLEDAAVKQGNSKQSHMNIRFRGLPEDEKREMSRLLARLLCAKGILPTSEFVDFWKMVKDTENKDDIEKELNRGGIIFINRYDDYVEKYRKENERARYAINVLSRLADRNKKNLCVIVSVNTDKTLKGESELGLNIFPYAVDFPDYSTKTLLRELKSMLDEEEFFLDEDAEEMLCRMMEVEKKNGVRVISKRAYLRDEIKDKLYDLYLKSARSERCYTKTDVEDAFREKKAFLQLSGKTVFRPSRIKKDRFCDITLPEGWPAELSEKTVIKAAEGAVLRIGTTNIEEGTEGKGTGFLISEDGYVVTCYHVIENMDMDRIVATINIPGREVSQTQEIPCKVIKYKREWDIAILQLENASKCPYLPLAEEQYEYNTYEEYVMRGHTFEETQGGTHYFVGHISRDIPVKDECGVDYYTVDGMATKGSSGSPIISLESGKVIGILGGAKFSHNEEYKEELNYIRPIKYFWQMLD